MGIPPPKFSVIIPSYARPRLLLQALESVWAQTCRDFELIVVADGGMPETVRAVSGLPIRLLVQERKGVAAARNLGVKEAQGSWMCFLDDDDLWHPDRLRLVGEYLQANPECEAVQADYWSFATAPTSEAEIVADSLEGLVLAARSETIAPRDRAYIHICGRSYDLLLERNRGVISTSTVSRELLLRAGGFPEHVAFADDWGMHLGVARLAEWHSLTERLAFVRCHPLNYTRAAAGKTDLVALELLRGVWSDPDHDRAPHRPLTSYGADYRFRVRAGLRTSVKSHRPRQALACYQVGWSLLPRWRDRVYPLLPEWLISLRHAIRPLKLGLSRRTN